MSEFKNILNMTNSLVNFVEANERFKLASLCKKLDAANREFPEDQTIGVIKNVLEKMSSKKIDISRSELKDLYQKLYQRNTKFAEVFSDELGLDSSKKEEKIEKKSEKFEYLDLNKAREEVIDPIFASALDEAFGGNRKPYNDSMAKKAENIAQGTFELFNLSPKCSVVAGKGNIFICSASFNTPRGETSVYVPVVIENDIGFSDSFIGNDSTNFISKQSIESYLLNNAGKKNSINPNTILDVLLKSASNEISDVDLAYIKITQAESDNPFLGPSISGQKLEEVNPNLVVNLPKNTDPQFESLSKQFESPLNAACFKHSAKVVQNGRDNIENSLKQWGIKTASTAVIDSDDGSITYAVSLNGGKAGFNVPVSVLNKIALAPEILICNGSIKEFSKDSLTEIFNHNIYDRVAVAAASPLYGTKPSELVNVIKEAVAKDNFLKAEDALNTLANSNDPKAYAAGLKSFTDGLNKVKQTKVATCNKPVAVKHSSHLYCSHTNLPLHKTFVDNDGYCQPIYREASQNSLEGSSREDKLYFRKG